MATSAPIILRTCPRQDARLDPFYAGQAQLVFHSAVSIIAEVGRRFRFHVEVYRLFVTMFINSVSALWKRAKMSEKCPRIIALPP